MFKTQRQQSLWSFKTLKSRQVSLVWQAARWIIPWPLDATEHQGCWSFYLNCMAKKERKRRKIGKVFISLCLHRQHDLITLRFGTLRRENGLLTLLGFFFVFLISFTELFKKILLFTLDTMILTFVHPLSSSSSVLFKEEFYSWVYIPSAECAWDDTDRGENQSTWRKNCPSATV
jgi:hypothetical protein